MKEDRFGDHLVNDGLISRAQPEEAPQVQIKLKTYKPIGQIPVDRNIITQRQLNFLLDKYRKRPPLGEILLQKSLITRQQLKIALEDQKKNGLRLGKTLLNLNRILQ